MDFTLAFINEKNETLLTRSGMFPLEKAYLSLLALREKHEYVALIVSKSDANGREIDVEFAEPLARARHEASGAVQGAYAQIWQRKVFSHEHLGKPAPVQVDLDAFSLRAMVQLADCGDDTRMLNETFNFTEPDIFGNSWHPVKHYRSCAVGDVIVLQSCRHKSPQAYMVVGGCAGYAKVALPEKAVLFA